MPFSGEPDRAFSVKPRRAGLILLALAGLLVSLPALFFLTFITPPGGVPPAVFRDDPRQELEREWAVAANYGVIWPEVEALLQLPAAGDAWERRLTESLRQELRVRRQRPERWRPIPARSWVAVRWEDDLPLREWWTPAGWQAEAVLLAAAPSGYPQPFPGATVFVGGRDDAQVAAMGNQFHLESVGELPPGVWVPPGGGSTAEMWRAAVMMLAVQRHQGLLRTARASELRPVPGPNTGFRAFDGEQRTDLVFLWLESKDGGFAQVDRLVLPPVEGTAPEVLESGPWDLPAFVPVKAP